MARSRSLPLSARIDPQVVLIALSILLFGAAFAWRVARAGTPGGPSEVPAAMVSRLDSLALGHTRGPATAPVRVVELADYECPACADAHRALWPLLRAEADAGRISYTVYDVPLPNHPNAIPATLAAACVGAGAPERFWEYRDLLFTRQDAWKAAYPMEPPLLAMAAGVGADTAQVRGCMAREATAGVERMRQGWETVLETGFRYTPMWSVNGKVVPWQDVERTVREAVAPGRG